MTTRTATTSLVGPENKAVRKDVTLGGCADELRHPCGPGLGGERQSSSSPACKNLRPEYAGEAEDRCDGRAAAAAAVASAAK